MTVPALQHHLVDGLLLARRHGLDDVEGLLPAVAVQEGVDALPARRDAVESAAREFGGVGLEGGEVLQRVGDVAEPFGGTRVIPVEGAGGPAIAPGEVGRLEVAVADDGGRRRGVRSGWSLGDS